ncbi:MAG: hypothetical protein II324_02165 [Selenomonadales bacterium]|nr:hypothetical protein [Selenomonadales bacterium]MBQ2245839.1 hypothetical protein [Selenomonadales bacterium]
MSGDVLENLSRRMVSLVRFFDSKEMNKEGEEMKQRPDFLRPYATKKSKREGKIKLLPPYAR